MQGLASFYRLPEELIMELILIRHGETTEDVEDRFGGDYDDELTERGRDQTGELARKMRARGLVPGIIFHSPKKRAVQTAEILSSALGVGREVVEEFRERNHYGILTGMKREEARERYGELVERIRDYRYTAEGAEPYDEFKVRVFKGFTEAIGKAMVEGIGRPTIVSHGGVIRAFFREMFGRELERIDDCSLFLIEIDGDDWTVKEMWNAELRQQ